ncbi:MAG: hypothetical protein Q4C71_02110 [Microbacteriaceae bacterium]|nr:hypothetical protein [Microbacteriaceae bacterium]
MNNYQPPQPPQGASQPQGQQFTQAQPTVPQPPAQQFTQSQQFTQAQPSVSQPQYAQQQTYQQQFAHTQAQQGQYGQQQFAQPGQYDQQQFAQQAPATPRPNPFAGIPVSDWLRDAAAVGLLLLSLTLPWLPLRGGYNPGTGAAATQIAVLLITLLSVFSVAIGYLGRAQIFGPNVTAEKVALFRAAANLPYIGMVVVYAIIALVERNLPDTLGVAAAVGLTGAIFAAIPRRYEIETPQMAHIAAAQSRISLIGVFGFVVVFSVVNIVITFVNLKRATAGEIILLISILLGIVAVASLYLLMLRRSHAAQLLSQAVGIASVVAVMFCAWGGSMVLDSFGYQSMILSLLAAIASHPALQYTMVRDQQKLSQLRTDLKQISLYGILGIVIFVVIGIVTIIVVASSPAMYLRNLTPAIILLVAFALAAIALVIVRNQVITNFNYSRNIVASIAGGFLVLGTVAVIILAVNGVDFVVASAIFYGIGGLLLVMLFADKEVRDHFAAFAPVRPQPQQQGFDPNQTGAYQPLNQTAAYNTQQFAQPLVPQQNVTQAQPSVPQPPTQPAQQTQPAAPQFRPPAPPQQ